jgi:hypothetical protein
MTRHEKRPTQSTMPLDATKTDVFALQYIGSIGTRLAGRVPGTLRGPRRADSRHGMTTCDLTCEFGICRTRSRDSISCCAGEPDLKGKQNENLRVFRIPGNYS